MQYSKKYDVYSIPIYVDRRAYVDLGDCIPMATSSSHLDKLFYDNGDFEDVLDPESIAKRLIDRYDYKKDRTTDFLGKDNYFNQLHTYLSPGDSDLYPDSLFTDQVAKSEFLSSLRRLGIDTSKLILPESGILNKYQLCQTPLFRRAETSWDVKSGKVYVHSGTSAYQLIGKDLIQIDRLPDTVFICNYEGRLRLKDLNQGETTTKFYKECLGL